MTKQGVIMFTLLNTRYTKFAISIRELIFIGHLASVI